MNNTITLNSSYGSAVFNAHGRLISTDMSGAPDEFGPLPALLDTREWEEHYPGESVFGEHDILDFAYWRVLGLDRGVPQLEYVQADETWREEFAKMRAKMRAEKKQTVRFFHRVAPLNSPHPGFYDALELSPVIEVESYETPGGKLVRVCERVVELPVPDKGVFWTIYGHIPGKGCESIGDFDTEEAALEVISRLGWVEDKK